MSKGGIALPESVQDRPYKGNVIAVSDDCKELSLGDVIVYTQFAGTVIEVDNEKVRILRVEDILAVLE